MFEKRITSRRVLPTLRVGIEPILCSSKCSFTNADWFGCLIPSRQIFQWYYCSLDIVNLNHWYLVRISAFGNVLATDYLSVSSFLIVNFSHFSLIVKGIDSIASKGQASRIIVSIPWSQRAFCPSMISCSYLHMVLILVTHSCSDLPSVSLLPNRKAMASSLCPASSTLSSILVKRLTLSILAMLMIWVKLQLLWQPETIPPAYQ